MSTDVSTCETNKLGCFRTNRGFAFRVWAPHATSVTVIGDFNNWDRNANPCVRDEGGNWYAEIEGVVVGQGYKFAITNNEKSWQRIDPRAKEVTNSVGHGIITEDEYDWQDDNFTMAAWNELIIYEMHVGSFNTVAGKAGTFQSCIDKLDYLVELGINAVELMPLAEFAGDFSWGYNPAHPFAIETAYGGVVGLKDFIRESHKRGIAVIVDVVYNHFGPSDLDLWQFDGWSENEKGGIYFFNDWRSSTPWGETRPDYGRQEVRQYIFDNALMWLEDFHADGLRYDMTLYIRAKDHDENNVIDEGFTLLQWINSEIATRYPGRITIAEDLQRNSKLTESTTHGGGGFDAQWDAAFVHPIREAITVVEDQHRSLASIKEAICSKYNHDVFERVIYTESHDEVANGRQRVVSEIDPSPEPNRYAIKRSTLGACLAMTSPGIPMLFQGQEFLREGWFDDSNPLDWKRAEKYSGIVALYRDLAALRLNRKSMSAGLSGQHVHVSRCDEESKILVMHRWKEHGPGDDVVVLFKLSEGPSENYRIGFPYDGIWKVLFNSDAEVYSGSMDGTELLQCLTEPEPLDGFEFSGQVAIGPYACVILGRAS